MDGHPKTRHRLAARLRDLPLFRVPRRQGLRSRRPSTTSATPTCPSRCSCSAGFISLWHMPLFFLLAGWSAVASLQTRGQRRFVGGARAEARHPAARGLGAARAADQVPRAAKRARPEPRGAVGGRPAPGGLPDRDPERPARWRRPSTRASSRSCRPSSRTSTASRGRISGSSPTCSRSPCCISPRSGGSSGDEIASRACGRRWSMSRSSRSRSSS